MPDAEDLADVVVLTAGDGHAVLVLHDADDLLAVDALGTQTGVTALPRPSAGANSFMPSASQPLRVASASMAVAGDDVLEALLADHLERLVEAEHQRDRRRERRRVLLDVLLIAHPVEVELRQRRALVGLPRLLATRCTAASPGGSMSPFCEPVMTTSRFHSSVLHSTAPMPVIESTMSTHVFERSDDLADRLDVVEHARRGLGLRDDDAARLGVLGERLGDVGGPHDLGPAVGRSTTFRP